jgi:hypothetical protein
MIQQADPIARRKVQTTEVLVLAVKSLGLLLGLIMICHLTSANLVSLHHLTCTKDFLDPFNAGED